jgi:CheY-like chemotaxis protein/nitrogen-specific signal transduction histidine kinase
LLLGYLVQNVAVALDNAQLCDELREHDRRKDEFLATLAHELRNPLAPLCTGLQLLQRSSDQTLRFVTRQTMERQLAHLSRLIDDLLDISRINLGKLRLRKSRFDFRTVVHTALEAIRPLMMARNHELAVDLPHVPLPLEADATRLCQVLINLLNNAAKYTPARGQITLSVTTSANTLTLQVRDNGVGISQDMLPRLFDLFMQIDSSVKYAQGGLGVGLPLVRRLVDMHGGTITASSDGLGKGSTFVIELPLAQSVMPVPVIAPNPAQLVVLGGLHILVVDDNMDAAEGLAALLQLSGHTVSLTHEGQNAVELATLLKPQVIVLDIGLPGVSGYEIARMLRRDDSYQPMLIALTGWGSEEDRQLALAAGFDEHLVKPVDINRLNELLQMGNYRCEQVLHDGVLPQAKGQA